MTSYLARRLFYSLLTLWLLSIAVFVLLRVAPGDAAVASLTTSPGEGALTGAQLEARRHELGLDRPLAVQYIVWAARLVRMDAGKSSSTGLSVSGEISPRLAVTAELAAVTILMVVVSGVVLGTMAAASRSGITDLAVRALALIALSAPAFWIGLMAIIGIAAWTGVFIAGSYQPLAQDIVANLRVILPAALVLAIRPTALLTRVVRTAVGETLAQEFTRAARARGLGERTVLWRHALRAAAAPIITVVGVEAVFLLGGAVLVEQLFSLPGIGRALVAGVVERDYALTQAVVMLMGVVAIALNFALDMLYVKLDSRVRLNS